MHRSFTWTLPGIEPVLVKAAGISGTVLFGPPGSGGGRGAARRLSQPLFSRPAGKGLARGALFPRPARRPVFTPVQRKQYLLIRAHICLGYFYAARKREIENGCRKAAFRSNVYTGYIRQSVSADRHDAPHRL